MRYLLTTAVVVLLAACSPKEGVVVDKLAEDEYEWVATEAQTNCYKVSDVLLCTTTNYTYRYYDDADYAIYMEDEKGHIGHVYVPRDVFDRVKLGSWMRGRNTLATTTRPKRGLVDDGR